MKTNLVRDFKQPLLFTVSLLIAILSLAPNGAALEVGVSSIDITPYSNSTPQNPRNRGMETPYGRIHLGGYGPFVPVVGSDRWARGVHDPIWSRAMAVRDSGKTLIMISTDLPGLVWKYINPARRAISKATGVPYENIVIASTHNHSGPDASGYWTTVQPGRNRAYIHQLVEWMVESGTNAFKRLVPAELKTLATTHLACQDRLTGELKKEAQCKFPTSYDDFKLKDEAGTFVYDQPIIQLDKRDPQVRNTLITVQHYVEPATKKTIATWINWHNHPDTLQTKGDNSFISSDFPHYVREYVEAKLGGTAIYFSGTVGCQIGPGAPVPYWNSKMEREGQLIRREEDLWGGPRSIGYEIGSEVVRAIQQDARPYQKTGEVSVRGAEVDIAPNNGLHLIATGPVWHSDVLDDEDRMRFWPARCIARHGCVRSSVESIQIGELSLLTGPGEIDPVYLYGRSASSSTWKKKRKMVTQHFKPVPGLLPHMKGPYVGMLGQAQNYLSYMFPESDFVGAFNLKHPNHYEDMVTVNRHFGDDVANLWHYLLGSDHRFNSRKIIPTPKGNLK